MTVDPAALGIPQDAMDRLAELQPGTKGHIFTSDLTVNEFLLVKQAGFTPLGLVLGTSVYRVAFDRPNAQVGRQQESIADSGVWVLPNPSGLNAHYPPAKLALLFAELRAAINSSGVM